MKFPIAVLIFLTLFGCQGERDRVLELTRKARELTAAKEYDEAVALADQALKLDPEHIDAYLEKGRAFEDRGDIEGAIEIYSLAVERAPKHIAANLILGNAYRRAGKLDDAVEWVTKGRDLAPGEGYIHHILGALFVQQNRIEDARVELERAVELDKDDAEFQMDLAKFYERVGEKELARERFQEVRHLVRGLPRFQEWSDYAESRLKALR